MSNIKSLIDNNYRIIIFLFFAIYLCVGISAFGDYGISWDEYASRNRGIEVWNYVISGDEISFMNETAYHGTAFEIILAFIENVFKLTKSPHIAFFVRHLITFLFFYISVFFFYRLCNYRFHSWKVGIIGSAFLIISPRIFAHSFYNSKDIPSLAMFIICIYTLINYLDKRKLSWAAFHAIVCAFLIDISIAPGIIIFFLTIVFFIADLLIVRKEKETKYFISFLTYICLFILFIIVFWPLLWPHPLGNFLFIVKQLTSFSLARTVLYLGNYVEVTRLPWHYIPVWIAISTPLLYSICFLYGCFVVVKSFLKNPRSFYVERRIDLIIMAWFFLPIMSAIISKLVLYDAWRHLFFIYPALLLLSLIGLVHLFKIIKARSSGINYKIINTVIVFVIIFGLIPPIYFMVKYHPYQNVYFNILAGRDMVEIKKNFELDYWGLSYRKALEYIVENDTSKNIRICVANWPGLINALSLKPADRERLEYVNKPQEADYFLSNYRWHPQEYPYKDEYFSIKIGTEKIMVVYRMR